MCFSSDWLLRKAADIVTLAIAHGVIALFAAQRQACFSSKPDMQCTPLLIMHSQSLQLGWGVGGAVWDGQCIVQQLQTEGTGWKALRQRLALVSSRVIRVEELTQCEIY